MQPVKKSATVLLISTMFIFFACEKEEKIIPPNPNVPTEIIIDAKVPSELYSNKTEITMDASIMKVLNDNRSLKYLWTCTQFPSDKKPFIIYPESVSTPVNKLNTGIYTFHLLAKDNFGNEANADYHLTVYQDTLNGPPVVPPMPAEAYTLPQAVLLISPNPASVNPVDRELKLNWTVVEQPVGSPAIDIQGSGGSALAKGCVPGKYVFQLEVTNELNLKASGLLEVTVHADIFAGTTRIYDNLKWTTSWEDNFFVLEVRETQISFTDRNKENTEISLWDFTNQSWMAPNTLPWTSNGEGVIIYKYPPPNGISDSTPAKVRITFK